MVAGNPYSAEQEAIRSSILQLAQTCEYEAVHTHHVTRLALRLFDELHALHNFGEKERFWLECAALLHDIGWIEGWKGHHKASLRIILSTPILLFSSRERYMVGSIARYHRLALPSLKHDHYAALDEEEREIVNGLAAMLRVADGLDRSHQSRVLNLQCKVTRKKVLVHCIAESDISEEVQMALQKGDLLVKHFRRKLNIDYEVKQKQRT